MFLNYDLLYPKMKSPQYVCLPYLIHYIGFLLHEENSQGIPLGHICLF